MTAPGGTLSAPAGPFLEVRALTKSFGGAPALRHVDLDILTGEVHGLIGANGAGKSTVIKILAGAVQPDSGSIALDGSIVEINGTQRSRALGLEFIHQELNLVPKFTIAQNLGLGQLPKGKIPLTLNKRALKERSREITALVGLNRSVSTYVEDLPVADQWLVCIGRALWHDARIIAMDEPTASLSHSESTRLFDLIHALKKRRIAIVYVSHRLDEVLDLCDRVTTLRDGRSVGTRPRSLLSRQTLVRTITEQELPGGETGDPLAQPSRTEEPVVATPEPSVAFALSNPGASGGPAGPVLEVVALHDAKLVDVSLAIAAGEVVGLAGLVGSGRSRLLRILFGVHRPLEGIIRLNGVHVRFREPRDAIAAGVAFVPEERRSQGLILSKSIAFNLSMASMRRTSPISSLPLYGRRRAHAWAREVGDRLQIKCRDVRDPVSTLSGGNQQKIVFGRWLASPLSLLLLDEPTRGVDVGARCEIHAIVRGIAETGAGVLMVSSEFQELLACDRVIVIREGAIVGELTGTRITDANMQSLCFSEKV